IIVGETGAEKRGDYKKGRPEEPVFRELDDEAKAALIKKDSRYGRIICRCETITEGEIVDAINRPCGARTVDGVKRRTRAGMGRCQGGFCGPRVIEILSRELGISVPEVRKDGVKSYMYYEKEGAAE
ncbi:MAG: (2Fe-2S)-binding protein, partial [Schwartzia sp.]|nr:(2Fe-2S)-binding protein [Schwartzia sp. (in: firmicutes)]